MGPEFWQTTMGQRLIEGTIPRIAKSLERIAVVLEKSGGNFNTAVQQQATEMMKRAVKDALDALEVDDDAPIDVQLTEKGMEVLRLTEKGARVLSPAAPEQLLRCPHCGTDSIEELVWRMANHDRQVVVSPADHKEPYWCPSCERRITPTVRTKLDPISDELEERARKVWGKLLPGETHTAKIRNALTPLAVLIDELTREDGDFDADQLQGLCEDAKKGLESTLDHLAAIDKERYELRLTIDDLKDNLRILASRVKMHEELEHK